MNLKEAFDDVYKKLKYYGYEGDPKEFKNYTSLADRSLGGTVLIIFRSKDLKKLDPGSYYEYQWQGTTVTYKYNRWDDFQFVTTNVNLGFYCSNMLDPTYTNSEPIKEIVENICNKKVNYEEDPEKPKPPTPSPQEPTDGFGTSCPTSGIYGGYGTKLTDIKLSLYANKVTKGTITLSKPQVEVGTFATDWRPNPSDYVERNSPAYKEIKGLAIQHNQDQNKKYIEVQATDGTVYGVDIWGGDAKKLLEQQQSEIEELKKLVQTLEAKINV